MKNFLSTSLMLLYFASDLFAFVTTSEAEKFYIDSKSILIGNNGIFADVNGEIIEV
jgi:hypothetical protein